MRNRFYEITKGTRALLQPNGIFIYNKRLNSFDVGNYTAREVIQKICDGCCLSQIIDDLACRIEAPAKDAVGKQIEFYLDALAIKGYILSKQVACKKHPKHSLFELRNLDNSLKLVYATIDITNRCNQYCLYCYAEANKFKIDMDGNKWIAILETLYKKGLRSVVISGGEPLLHPNFWKILDFCCEHFITEVNTNGQLIRQTEAQKLANYNLKAIQISIDSADEKTHDAYRGKGTWKRVMDASLILKSYGLPIRISMTVRPETISKIEPLRRYANLHGFLFNAVSLKKAGRASYLDSSLWQSLPADQKIRSGFQECEKFEARCGGIVGFAGISSDGSLKACNMPPSFFLSIGGGMEIQKSFKWIDKASFGSTDVGKAFLNIEKIGSAYIDKSTDGISLKYSNCILERYYIFLELQVSQRDEPLLSMTKLKPESKS